MVLSHDRSLLLRHARDQNGVISFFLQHLCDAADLFGSLSGPVDHLGRALPDLAVMVHHGISEIGKGLLFDLQNGVIHRKTPVPD